MNDYEKAGNLNSTCSTICVDFFDLSAKDKNTTTYYVNASVERRDPRYPTLRGVGAKGAEVVFRATYDGYEQVEEKWVTNEYRMNVLLLFTKEK